MTRLRTRLRAPRLPLLLLVGWSCVSAMGAGCSSGVKTVTVDCPTGGASGSAGQAAMTNGGSAPSGDSAGAADEAGEAGASGTESGRAQGGMSVGGRGSAGANGGGHAGHAGAGTGGHGGGTSGGANTSGGHGGVGGSSASGGSSGAETLSCGDKVVTPPEFCDDGTNTDFSYGCYPCTTLPPATAPQGAQQCDACLQQTPTQACFACQDHRACYACLRRQPSSFPASADPDEASDTHCSIAADDDVVGDPFSHRQLSDECFNPHDPIGSGQIGGPAGSATRGSVCQALLACALRTGCATGTAPDGKPRDADGFSGCYCGDGRNCQSQTAAGPCVQEVRAAAAVPPMLSPSAEYAYLGANYIDAAPTDAWVMLGVVSNLLQCAHDGCASACYSSATGTAAAGGTAGSGGTAGHGGSGGSAGHGGGP